MSQQTARYVADALTSAAMTGTGKGIFDGLGYRVAGKTGTAQLPGHQRPHSWFVGFAPADHPTVAFAVVIEHGGSGREAAAPIVRRLLPLVIGATGGTH